MTGPLHNPVSGGSRAERRWILIASMILVAFLIATLTLTVHSFNLVPGTERRATPAELLSDRRFSRPGVYQTDANHYAVYAVGKAWEWRPNPIRVPAGAEITFYLTSADVLHGFRVLRTNINVMAIPSNVARVSHTFEHPGDYPIVCTEYCGVGHQNMLGRIIVEVPAQPKPGGSSS